MADRATIRTGFPQEEFPGGRFTRAPDPRFGGNMARANEGAQYVGSPRYEHGAYLKGSPMHDAQYGNYVAPHRVDYTRNAPPQSSGTPNFRPPYGAPGKPSYNEWLQQIDPFHTGSYPPKKHPNPRMRGMGGGLESSGIMGAMDFDTRQGYDFNPRPNIKGHFQEPAFHKFPQSGPAGAPVEGPWNREYDDPMMREMGGGLEGLENDPFDPRRLEGYDPFNNQIFTDPFDPSRLGSFDESKIDLNDIFNRFPGMNLWRLIQELDKRGIEYANRGGLMSLRR
jgi:hypothetical protein